MPSIGNTTKPSGPGWWEQFGSTYNQGAMPYVMPTRGTITRLGQWISAVGGSLTMRLCVWSSSNALLGQTGLITVATEPAGVDRVSRYEGDLAVPVTLEAGASFSVGFSRDPAKTHQLTGRSGETHRDRKRAAWPGSMDGYDQALSPHLGNYGIGSYVAVYGTGGGAWAYRSGVWVQAEAARAWRSGVAVDAEVKVYRAGIWVNVT